MLPDPAAVPTAGVVFGVGLVALGFYGLVRTLRATRAPDATVHPERAAVDCETCGTENGLEYRFCRDCADALPPVRGVDADVDGTGGSTAR